MSIKRRIHALQALVALAAVLVGAAALINFFASNYYLSRAQWAHRQLAAISQLAIDANRYSEQIAELLLIGGPERPDFESARMEVGRAFAQLREAALEEAAFIRDTQDRQAEQIELQRLERMQELFRQIDRAVERLLLLDQQGRSDEAITLFRSEIENLLDAEFARLIAEARTDEQQEVSAIEADLVNRTRWLTIMTVGASGILLVTALLSGFLFVRSIQRPIKALTDGARAIELGNFDHRITPLGRDEHAVLSHRFNTMAEQLGRQRAMLMATHDELEGQVAERTLQLAEANRRLVATDEQRVRLLTDISHELRTPLTALRGEAEIVLRGSAKPEMAYRDALMKVVARAADLARLVEDLLFLARSEAEEIRFDFQRLNLVDLVAQAVEEAEVLGLKRQIQIRLAESIGHLMLRADQRRLKQATLVVLDNAVKYGSPGTLVEVALRRERDTAELSVRDSGPGISADEAERVFERFYRGASARDQLDGGTGLGLPIARWIVEKHGGTIELSSIVGEGTEVLIRFPIAS